MIYEIDSIEIIKDTDWSYLEETDENKITLITCVENEPNYRRCVQATQKE
jgi:LPXTG-site transpeptidase (sortase) family protein